MLYFIIMINPTYERRGKKTLVILLIVRLIPAFLFLIVVLLMASFKGQLTDMVIHLTGKASPVFIQTYNLVLGIGFLLFLLFVSIFVLFAWLEYISFSYFLDTEAFKAQTGIINIKEMSVLYHQIQNVDISRPLLYRMTGMSRLVILTAGHEDPNAHKEEQDDSEVIIDIIDAAQAEELQHELLSRANIVHVHEEGTVPSVNPPNPEHTS